MKITRRFTEAGKDVYESIAWERRSSRITGADGAVVFEMHDAEIPASWSQLATDIVVSKYFRKAGVPQVGPDGKPRRDAKGNVVTGPERSVRQVVHRLVACWKQWGQKHGYFDSRKDAEAFYDELAWMLLNQVAAPNSPQWFNTGLHTAYGITGPAQGHWIADPASGEPSLASDAYTHPQPHACFIQSVRDDLVNEGGIMDLWVREARLFKYGSGTGTNFSSLRGENEPLSGGGRSSGCMSFLRIGDRAASAIKSGGTTRRAAKMVVLDADHPDIVEFVRWKVREEIKVAALVEGMKHLPEGHRELAERLGLRLDYDFNGEAYYTVSGQNSNNSVRVTDEYLRAVEEDRPWDLLWRTSRTRARTIRARELWDEVCFAAWRCADPGIQFDTTINQWHTCPNSGRINASNPCSEYMFLDNTACNLASLNLLRFYDPATRIFDVEGYEHAIRLWTIVLEISVLMAAFPSREIAELSWQFRTLGLGYANLGAMLMQAGIAYDSEEARAICGTMSAILTGRAYATSAEMAKELGPFDGFEANRQEMLRVIRNHRRAARGVSRAADSWEGLNIPPVPIDHTLFSPEDGSVGRLGIGNARDILQRAESCWDDALRLGEKHGFRNAQVTVIAPTGTIGLLMDCDTTGVEPDFALTKFKKLAGGGYFKIVNQSLPPALRALGYAPSQVADIQRYVLGTLSLDVPLPEKDGFLLPAASRAGATLRDFLISKGYTSEQLVAVENDLPKVFELRFAFAAWTMPEQVLARLGLTREAAAAQRTFNGLRAMGLTKAQVETLNRVVCGTQTVEGAPHLKAEHLPVFDCANKCGTIGQRFIAPEGHIRMMAAAQSFISGAISKTINLPHEASVEDISAAYLLSWRLGLKANALYRDGCKLSQPLNTKADPEEEEDEIDEETLEAVRGEALGEVAAIAAAISTCETSDECDECEVTVTIEARSTGLEERPASSDDLRLADSEEAIEGRCRPAADGPRHPSGEGEDLIPASKVEALVAARVREAVEALVNRPMRRRLPDTRHSVTHRFNVCGHEGYLTVGLHTDGSPGELFITMAKEGSTIGGLMDSLGTATSVALQYGVPLASLVRKFAHQRFEPMGMTTNRDIPFASSLVDYIFRWLGMEFIPGYREEHAPQREERHEQEQRDQPVEGDRAIPDTMTDARLPRHDGGSRVSHGSTLTEEHSWNEAPSHRSVDGLRADGTEAARSPSSPSSHRRSAEMGQSAHPDTGGSAPEGPASRSGDRHGGGARIVGSASTSMSPAAAVGDFSATTSSRATRDRSPHTGGQTGGQTGIQTGGARAGRVDVISDLMADITATRTIIGPDGVRTTRVHELSLERHTGSSVQAAALMGDAPACANCGHITVRSGACYKCLNCGAQNGCG